MKPFDDKFAENVRDVFDNWEEPVDELAWQAMKSRLKKKSRFAVFALPVWQSWAAAAVLLLILGSGALWQFNRVSTDTEIVVANESTPAPTTQIPIQQDETTAIIATPFSENEATEAIGENQVSLSDLFENEFAEDQRLIKSESPVPVLAEDYTPQETLVDQDTDILLALESTDSILNLVSNNFDTTAIADNAEVAELPQSFPVVAQDKNRDNQIIEHNLSFMNDRESSRSANPGIEFSAGSMKTYSSAEVAGGLGYSAGISGQWPLNEWVSFGGGGMLVYNQFSLDDPYASRGNDRLYASPELDSSGEYIFFSRNNSTDVEYMAIDIPLNFRFKLTDIAKGHVYVSAGLSSYVYLQQNYTSHSEVYKEHTAQFGNGISRSEISSVTTTDEFDAFKRVDMWRYLNLSFGYLMKRERHSLLVEPFVKYPLGDVTSMDLQIGMVGVALKYQFSKP